MKLSVPQVERLGGFKGWGLVSGESMVVKWGVLSLYCLIG